MRCFLVLRLAVNSSIPLFGHYDYFLIGAFGRYFKRVAFLGCHVDCSVASAYFNIENIAEEYPFTTGGGFAFNV